MFKICSKFDIDTNTRLSKMSHQNVRMKQTNKHVSVLKRLLNPELDESSISLARAATRLSGAGTRLMFKTVSAESKSVEDASLQA